MDPVLALCISKVTVALEADPPMRFQAFAAIDQYLHEIKKSSAINDESHIAELGLDARIANALEKRGIQHVGGLRRWTREALVDIRQVNHRIVDQIEEKLSMYGIKLSGRDGREVQSPMIGEDQDVRLQAHDRGRATDRCDR